MDAKRFDTLVRDLLLAPSRRGVLAGLASSLLATFSLALGGEEVAAKKKRKKKHKKKKKPTSCVPNCTDKECGDDGCGNSCGTCGSCADCQGGSCVTKPDDAACEGDGKCLNGTCNPLPTCVPYAENCHGDPASCCGLSCPNGPGTGQLCGPSQFDDPCVDDGDCFSNDCVGYRCRKGGQGAGCGSNEDCLSNACLIGTCN